MQLSSEDLSRLTGVDHHDSEALVAVTLAGEPVGYALLRQLAHRAGVPGSKRSPELPCRNRDMIQLLRELGPAVKNHYEQGGVVEVEVELPTNAERATRPRIFGRRAGPPSIPRVSINRSLQAGHNRPRSCPQKGP